MIAGSLRGRVVVLAALIAVLATAVCAALAARAVAGGLHEQRLAAAQSAADYAARRLRGLADRLAFEVMDYAEWDELHDHMPRPPPEWAMVNLAPAPTPGRLTQVFVAVDQTGAVTGRFRRFAPRGPEPSGDDPAPPGPLGRLAGSGRSAGLAAPGGLPLLYAAHPIRRSAGDGEPRGSLMAIAYVDDGLTAELVAAGYQAEIAAVSRMPDDASGGWSDGRAWARAALPAADGAAIVLTVREAGAVDEGLLHRTIMAVAVGGAISAVVAILIGIVLGWEWMRPLSVLAAACRRRAGGAGGPWPELGGLREAEVLGDALRSLERSERQRADELASALDRERTANAVHQRFLAQLAHELGDPIHALVGTIARLSAAGSLPPEELAAAHDRALELESRLQEVLGLAVPTPSAQAVGEREAAEFLAVVADLLRPLAARRGGAVAVDGQGRGPVRGELLAPALVNLAGNALRARAGAVVRIAGRCATEGSVWSVSDDAGGIEPGLAARIHDACVRGEVLPGTPGIGLGLAIVLANVRALGGAIRLDNRAGEGATFTIRLGRGAGASGMVPAAR